MALAPNQFQSALRLARRNMVANTKPIVIMMPQIAPMTKAVINQAVDTSHIVRLNEFSDFPSSIVAAQMSSVLFEFCRFQQAAYSRIPLQSVLVFRQFLVRAGILMAGLGLPRATSLERQS
jgi:hypothetical protein